MGAGWNEFKRELKVAQKRFIGSYEPDKPKYQDQAKQGQVQQPVQTQQVRQQRQPVQRPVYVPVPRQRVPRITARMGKLR